MEKTDILVFSFSPIGRDPEALIPLCWYLENVFKYNLKYGSVFDGLYLIDKYHPKVLLFANISGAQPNIEVANYAYKKGIKVITLTAEGLFREKDMVDFIWGNDKKKNINWHKMFVWSDKYLDLTKKFLPQYSDSFDVSGYTSIDRYIIYKFLSQRKFPKKYKKEKFKKVIMYAGFNFGHFFDEKYLRTAEYSQKEIEFYRKDMKLVKEILCQVFSANPEILFILKKHPGESNLKMEIDYSWETENVMIFDDQEPIADLINVADLFFVYRSTTSFEAYALNKIVTNVFPSGDLKDIQPDQLGNCIAINYQRVQKIIDEYYQTGRVKEFDKKSEIRKKIIHDSLGGIDGQNSYRTAVKINDFLKNQQYDFKEELSVRGLLMHLLLKYNFLLKVLPRFRNSEILKKYNEFPEFYDLKKKYSHFIKDFYQQKSSR